MTLCDSMNCSKPWNNSLSFTLSRSLLKLMSIELMMISNQLLHCCPLLLLPSTLGFFPVSRLFASGGQSTGASASEQGMAALSLAGGCQIRMQAQFYYILFIFPKKSHKSEFSCDIFPSFTCWQLILITLQLCRDWSCPIDVFIF